MSLDRTLIRSLDWELFVFAVLRSPSNCRQVIRATAGGIGNLRRTLSELVSPSEIRLPWRQELLEQLAEHRAEGKRLVLTSKYSAEYAARFGEQLGVFSDAVNVADPISPGLSYRLGAAARFDESPAVHGGQWIERVAAGVRMSVRACRVKHWTKNLLVFLPLLLSHRWFDFARWEAALAAFACFCLCSSGVYCLNDLLDLQHDRRHPAKRLRPFASGNLPLWLSPMLSFGLFAAGTSLAAAALSGSFVLALLAYVAITCAYSFGMKRVVLVDVFTLAGLFTLRVFAGGLATETFVSEWMMAYSVFFFLSLAFLKRYAELRRLRCETGENAAGRGYLLIDEGLVETLGPMSGYLSVLVLTLYITSNEVVNLYPRRQPLWLVAFLLLYWVTWIWMNARRGEPIEDPVDYVIRRPMTWAIGVMVAGLILAASIANS